MVSLTLLSTVLMGLLVVGTFAAVARIGSKRTAPGTDDTVDRYTAVTHALRDLARTPAVWSIAFIVLALGVGGLAVLAVGNFALVEGLSGSLFAIVYAIGRTASRRVRLHWGVFRCPWPRTWKRPWYCRRVIRRRIGVPRARGRATHRRRYRLRSASRSLGDTVGD